MGFAILPLDPFWIYDQLQEHRTKFSFSIKLVNWKTFPDKALTQLTRPEPLIKGCPVAIQRLCANEKQVSHSGAAWAEPCSPPDGAATCSPRCCSHNSQHLLPPICHGLCGTELQWTQSNLGCRNESSGAPQRVQHSESIYTHKSQTHWVPHQLCDMRWFLHPCDLSFLSCKMGNNNI